MNPISSPPPAAANLAPAIADRAAAESCCGSACLASSPGPQLDSTLTCPQCGHVSAEIMPTNACAFFHECAGCHTLLRPLAGDCCVFCSYGSVPCPPIQAGNGCC